MGIFFRLFFATAKVASIAAMIFFHKVTLILWPMIAGGGGLPNKSDRDAHCVAYGV